MVGARRALLLTLAVVLAIACSQPSAQRAASGSSGEVVAVHVTSAGVISLNGREISLEDLKLEFARLATVGGTVRYSRDNPTGEPHPNAMKVIEAVAEANLPIQLVQR